MIERIGAIIRETRERDGRAVEEVAAQSGVAPATIASLEAGRSGITTVQLANLAAALALDYAALLQGRSAEQHAPSVFFRHSANQDFDDQDSAALDEALDQGRALGGLRALLGDPPLALQSGAFVQQAAAADRSEAPAREGYGLARDVRRWLQDAAAPLGDLRALGEERFGVAIVVHTLKSKRVTAAALRAGTAAAIVLNAGDAQRVRNPLLGRVYIAHELCHVLFDPSPGGLHIVLDLENDRLAQDAEQRARAFAAELLLPQDGLTQLLGPARRTYDFAIAKEFVATARSRFGTPHEIAANHLCNTGFVDPRMREWLVVAMTSFSGAQPPLSVPAVGRSSILVERLVERTHSAELLTDSEARRILGLGPIERLPWEEVEL